MNTKDKLSAKQRSVIWFGFSLVAISYMSIKLSVPVLPILAKVFEVNPIYLKLSATCFLLSLAASQVWWGGVARFLDRRRIIFLGLAVAMVGTICAMCATNVWVFIIGRAIEGAGVGVASPICRVLMADTLTHHQMAKISFFFGVIFNFAPFIAPTLGQYLIIYLGWRSVFAFFFVFLLIYYFLFYFKLPETRGDKPQRYRFHHVFKNYGEALTNARFWLYISPFILYVGSMLSYYMAIPYWYWQHFGVSQHYYTLLAIFTAIPNLTSYYYSRFVIKRWGTPQTLVLAAAVGSLALPCAILFAVFYHASVIALICPLMLWSVAAGFAQPAVNASILNHFRHNSGPVSGLLPVLPFIFASLMFLVWTNISLDTLWPFVGVIAGLVFLSLGSAYFIYQRRK